MDNKIILIGCIALLSIFLSVFGLRLFIYLSLKSMNILSKTFDNKKKKVVVKLADEDLLRSKRREEKQKQEVLQNTGIEEEVTRMRNEQAVEFAKPIGFWTSKLIGEGLTNMLKDKNISWVDLIKTKNRQRQREMQHEKGSRGF